MLAATAGLVAAAPAASIATPLPARTVDLVQQHLALQAKLKEAWARYDAAVLAAEESIDWPVELIVRPADWFSGAAAGRRPGDRASLSFIQNWREAETRPSSLTPELQAVFEARRAEVIRAGDELEARRVQADQAYRVAEKDRDVDRAYEALDSFEARVVSAAPNDLEILRAKASVALRMCRPMWGMDSEVGAHVVKALEDIVAARTFP